MMSARHNKQSVPTFGVLKGVKQKVKWMVYEELELPLKLPMPTMIRRICIVILVGRVEY